MSPQSGFDQDENDKIDDDEAGFGLGMLGLASPTLPSDDMMVPPLNFSMVRRAELMDFSSIFFCYLPCGTTVVVRSFGSGSKRHSLLDAVRTLSATRRTASQYKYIATVHFNSILQQSVSDRSGIVRYPTSHSLEYFSSSVHAAELLLSV